MRKRYIFCNWRNARKKEMKISIYNRSRRGETILMSRYGDREFLTEDQGARLRFYLMYRLNNNLQGNTLQER